MSTHAEDALAWIKRHMERDPPVSDSPDEMAKILRVMAVWRATAIAAGIRRVYGSKVLNGPFAGMEYLGAATEGALAPRLIGSYESELHPYIEAFAAQDFDCVIDVGCAEGYYAVGLARLMSGATVYAYDTEDAALAACRQMAAANGVADRVVTGGLFTPTTFEDFKDRRCLVIMDVEGAEQDLLRPDLAPSLAAMSLIVETHDVYRKDALKIVSERMAPTHDIVRVDMQGKTTPLPEALQNQSHMDQLLAVWEWRLRPTPWLVMTPKSR